MSRGAMKAALIAHRDPQAAASEAYRVLRTNLQFAGVDQPLRSVLITSATPGEGKSTTAANLAVAFAQSGMEVCLLDADLRRPTIHKLFGVENWRGLTSALINQGGLDAALQPSGVPGLTLLTSGPLPPNPAEMLASAQMAALLDELEQRFEMVLIDTPPVLAVTDAAVLAPKADGALLVVRAGRVARQQVVQARAALTAVQARVLGAVLGCVQPEPHSGYYYYSYGEYHQRDR